MKEHNVPFTPNGLAYLVYSEKPKAQEMKVGDFTISSNANDKEPPVEGVVVCEGDGASDYEQICKYERGARVVFGRYAGQPWTHNGVEYTILAENEILGRVNPV